MRPHDPWKWPASIVVALVFLGSLFLLPRAWIFLLPQAAHSTGEHLAARTGRWLVLHPPPEIEVETPQTPPAAKPDEPPVFRPADWWRRGVAVAITGDDSPADLVADRPAAVDSIRTALDMLGVAPDLLTRARPDSILAARLRMLRVEEGFRFDELKPYLYALSRAAAYADIMSRSADMFGDFLDQEIMVTPRADGHGESP